MFQTVIIAGGLATRLWPETKTIPKSLISISEKPFIDWQLTLLKEKGISEILLCVGYLGEQIEDFVGNGKKWGVNVSYSYEGERLLGTGGALRNALNKLDDKFFITYGDSYLPINYKNVLESFKKSNESALMTVYKNNGQFDKSNVAIENNKIKKYIKNSNDPDLIYIDYGLLIMSKDIIAKLPENETIDLAKPLQDLVEKDKLATFEVEHRFYEIGSRSGIEMLENYLKESVKSKG